MTSNLDMILWLAFARRCDDFWLSFKPYLERQMVAYA